MTLPGIAKRRGVQHMPELASACQRSDFDPPLAYFTPPPSRSSEPAYAQAVSECKAGGRSAGNNDVVPGRLSSPAEFEDLQFESTFFDRSDDVFHRIQQAGEEGRAQGGSTGRRTRHGDDYGIAYSIYQDDDVISLPDTPEDDRASLNWDSTFDPFTSATFRRGSLVLDPAAFDSTPSVDTSPQWPSSGTAVRLRKSAEALRELGRKVLPRLKLKTRSSDSSVLQAGDDSCPPLKSHKATGSSSTSNTFFSGRTRSNTVESTRSSRSIRSKRSSANLTNSSAVDPGAVKEASSLELLSPLATYKSANAVGSPVNHTTSLRDETNEPPRFGPPSIMASPTAGSKTLFPVIERDQSLAPLIQENIPKLASPYNATDPGLEEIMRQMQEEDEAYETTEQSMRSSGWSSENEIHELRRKRQEQQNLWQRRLEDALDQVKARVVVE